ncbi:MAG: Gx transporter family protein [Calditerrivibrio sp.]|nr:Gx transporter family protein [Calditerrivibrio sp.]MCA1980036.1 Gx transporter family protein [Calditerrivibrio sp.]
MSTTQYQDNIKLVSLLAAISIVFGIIENIFPLPIPFLRLGLSNIGIVIGIYLLNLRYVLLLGGIKATITAIFSTGFIFRIIIAYPSILFSIIVMYIFYFITKRFSTAVSVSVVGSMVNISTQFIIIKTFIIKNLDFLLILPYFLIVSIFTGIIVGYISNIVLKKIT